MQSNTHISPNHESRLRILRCCIVLLFIFHPSSFILSQDTIKANPKAVQLKLFWKIKGVNADDYVGVAAGGIGDINGDGKGEFMVLTGVPWQWSLYHGDAVKPRLDTTWKFDSGSAILRYPVVGNFYGKDQKTIGLGRFQFEGPTSRSHFWWHFFRVGNGRIADTASVVWDSFQKDGQEVAMTDVGVADLDGDGADELIIFAGFVLNSPIGHPQIWIYKGGPDFQVDTPTVILRDPESNGGSGNYHGTVLDLDGDTFLDLITSTTYGSRAYWGRGSVPTDTLVSSRLGNLGGMLLGDFDGDNIADVAIGGMYIYRSGSGKNARTRSYDTSDADTRLFMPSSHSSMFNLGYLNNKKYKMLAGMVGGPMLIGFSGGANGPNRTYDCYYSAQTDFVDNIFVNVRPTSDIDGDGWDDLIVSNPYYYSNWNYGMAIILKGGPYIPNDDPTVIVHSIASEGKQDAIRMWPNPVSTELNIAWRGNLKQMPERFVVHNALGQYVIGGSVPEGSGSAVWECSGVPSGVYRVLIYDGNSVLLAQKQIIKQ